MQFGKRAVGYVLVLKYYVKCAVGYVVVVRGLEDENLSRTSVWGPRLSRGFFCHMWPTEVMVLAKRVNILFF